MANYINNKELFAALCDWMDDCEKAATEGRARPPVPRYVGESIILLAERIATKPNFSKYPFIEEMKGDGIENCIKYIHNFNPQKSQNPFSYFTQIITYAFLRRIDREKKQLYVKHKTLENSMIMHELADSDDADTQAISVNLNTDYMNNFVKNFEKNLEERKEKRIQKKSGIDKFVEE